VHSESCKEGEARGRAAKHTRREHASDYSLITEQLRRGERRPLACFHYSPKKKGRGGNNTDYYLQARGMVYRNGEGIHPKQGVSSNSRKEDEDGGNELP